MAQLVDNRLCPRLVTVAQSHRWRKCSFLTERQTCFFFPSSEPAHCGISAASWSTQPTAVSFVTLFSRISVEVYYGRAVYTNLLYYSPSPGHHTLTVYCFFAVFMLRSKNAYNKQSQLVHFVRWEWDDRSVHAGNGGGCFAETCSEGLNDYF